MRWDGRHLMMTAIVLCKWIEGLMRMKAKMNSVGAPQTWFLVAVNFDVHGENFLPKLLNPISVFTIPNGMDWRFPCCITLVSKWLFQWIVRSRTIQNEVNYWVHKQEVGFTCTEHDYHFILSEELNRFVNSIGSHHLVYLLSRCTSCKIRSGDSLEYHELVDFQCKRDSNKTSLVKNKWEHGQEYHWEG